MTSLYINECNFSLQELGMNSIYSDYQWGRMKFSIVLLNNPSFYSNFKIILLALSIAIVSNEAK